jgi:predicted metalloprotease with PDZ domain
VDQPYCGPLRLHVDVTDVERRIYRAKLTIPVTGSGPLTLLYPKWLPGYHAPQAPIELFAGLVITAGGSDLDWRRHPVTVNAFHVEVPAGACEIVAEFQFLTPTEPSQGRVLVTPDMLCLQWNSVMLYPAGHFARAIEVEPTLVVPEGWQFACALEQTSSDGVTTCFKTVSLDVLVDSPVLAGRHFRSEPLDLEGTVRLNIAADRPELLPKNPGQLAPYRELVVQADLLFGARHFQHYDFLLGLSDELGAAGIEHHQSCEAISIPNLFTAWDRTFVRRDSVPHEYVHSWNGKHRRGADSWSANFEMPIRNSLMWVYEGLTQYWGQVLCARSGLWNPDQARGALAQTAATYDARPGSRWRPMIDTTRDPIIAARSPLPWTSWQRSEDYYSEGALMWLDVDTRIRELSGDTRSLDDFARAFFGKNDGSSATDTYVFEDVVRTLEAIAPFGWHAFFVDQLDGKRAGAPLEGIERGGYRLVYRESPSKFGEGSESVAGRVDLTYSVGAALNGKGKLTDVLWGGPVFEAGLTVGTELIAVSGQSYSEETLKQAIASAASGAPLELVAKTGNHVRSVFIVYDGGLRYPHLERVEGTRARLDDIYAAIGGDS